MSGWIWRDDAFDGLDDDARELEEARREPTVRALATELSNLRTEREQRGFQRQWEAEDGLNHDPEYDTPEEEAAAELQRQTTLELERAREEALEAKLGELGARMMRAYEHWNEEERLMAYLERDR